MTWINLNNQLQKIVSKSKPPLPKNKPKNNNKANITEAWIVLVNDDNKVRNLPGTAEIMEWARDSLYTRGDLNQIAVWKDGIHSFGKKLYYYQAIHQESDVVPENIDAIRAMCNIESDFIKSVEKTNKALGINW